MAIRGNPFENAWRAVGVSGVDLANGTYSISDVDIALPAAGSWLIGRTYNARQEYSGSYSDAGAVQGKNWMQTSQPEILLHDDATSAANDIVYVFYGADRFVEYQRASASSSTFRSSNGSAGVVAFTAAAGGEPETYELVDQNGREFVFFGFDANASPAGGQIWTITDPAGNKAYVGDATTGSTAITSGYTDTGRISKAYDSADRRYTYTYDGTTDRLTPGALQAWLHAPTACVVLYTLGTDDGAKASCNATLLHEGASRHGASPMQVLDRMQLAQGWNRILFKVENARGGFGLYFRVLDGEVTSAARRP